MFKKKRIINATAVLPLNERNVEFLKLIQMNHPIPEDATHIAFLEDGDACFLEDFSPNSLTKNGFTFPQMHIITYYTNVPIEYQE